MLRTRNGNVYITRRSLLRAGVAALAVGGTRAWALPRGGGVATASDALSALLAQTPANTWVNITTQGGQSSSDYQQACYGKNAGAVDYNSTVATDIGGDNSCIDMLGVYEGGAFDAHANRFLIGVGGAHSQAYDNSVLQFDLASLKWSRITTPDDAYISFRAVGSIAACSPGQTTVMTITSMTSGFIAPNGRFTYTNDQQAALNGVINQLTNTDSKNYPNGGGPGTYTVLNLNYGFPSIPPGTTITDVGLNTAGGNPAQTTTYSELAAQCPSNSAGPIATHSYSSMRWVPNFPDAAGSLVVASLMVPTHILYLSAITGLPTSGINWQTPGRPTDSTRGGVPTADCGHASPWHLASGPNNAWNYNTKRPTMSAGNQTNGCFIPLAGPPGQCKMAMFQGEGVGPMVLYDLFGDTGPSSNPFRFLNNSQTYLPGGDPGSVPQRGPIASSASVATEAWLSGGAINANESPKYAGLAKFNLATGVRSNLAPTSPNGLPGLAALAAYAPYVCWHPGDGVNGDRFIQLTTEMVTNGGSSQYVSYTDPVNGTSNVRNTSNFGGVSPGNILDIINPNPGTPSISQIITQGGGGNVSTTNYPGYPTNCMPPDLNFSGRATGDGQKLVYVPKYNCLALLTTSSNFSKVASVYIYKPGPKFPYS